MLPDFATKFICKADALLWNGEEFQSNLVPIAWVNGGHLVFVEISLFSLI